MSTLFENNLFHDFPAQSCLSRRSSHGRPKQLWGKIVEGDNFLKLLQEGSMYLYIMWSVYTYQFAKRCCWCNISIANCGHCYNSPPKWGWYTGKFCILFIYKIINIFESKLMLGYNLYKYTNKIYIYENDLFQQNSKDLKISKHQLIERVTINPILFYNFSKSCSWIGDRMNDEPI